MVPFRRAMLTKIKSLATTLFLVAELATNCKSEMSGMLVFHYKNLSKTEVVDLNSLDTKELSKEIFTSVVLL